ncbi:MAG TPA: glycine cleavage system protein H [Bacteroidota bacterium]
MFPGVYGFTWDAAHLIFLGVFFTVALVIASTVTVALLRARRQMRLRAQERIRWQEDFHDLSAGLRACRHALTGELPRRVCPNAFDCRACEVHLRYPEREVAADRYYHRGHTWVQPEEDGTFLVGLDDIGRKVFGRADAVILPKPGAVVQANGTGWSLERNGASVRVLSPVDGEVVETGGADQGWFLRLRPPGGRQSLAHLLRGAEVDAWFTRELERLEMRLGTPEAGISLADGGELLEDLPGRYPAADWDSLWGEVFLEP